MKKALGLGLALLVSSAAMANDTSYYQGKDAQGRTCSVRLTFKEGKVVNLSVDGVDANTLAASNVGQSSKNLWQIQDAKGMKNVKQSGDIQKGQISLDYVFDKIMDATSHTKLNLDIENNSFSFERKSYSMMSIRTEKLNCKGLAQVDAPTTGVVAPPIIQPQNGRQ